MPLKLTGDFAAGRIDEQFDTAAILVERIDLGAGVLQLGFLDFVPECLDFGLQRFEREPLGRLCHVRGLYLSIGQGALGPHLYISIP